VIPELGVKDVDKSLEFYTKVLGFKVDYQRKDPRFVFLSLQGAQLMIEQVDTDENSSWYTANAEYPFGRGMNLQIEVDDVDILVESLKKNDYPIKMVLEEKWYQANDKLVGNKQFLVMDPDGYLLRFAKTLAQSH